MTSSVASTPSTATAINILPSVDDLVSSLSTMSITSSSATSSSTASDASASASSGISSPSSSPSSSSSIVTVAPVEPKSRLLILFDLGGTWIERSQVPLRSVSRDVTMVKGTGGNKYVYYRSDRESLQAFAALQDDPFVQLGIYTTMSDKYAQPIVDQIEALTGPFISDRSISDSKSDRLPLLVFSQGACVPDPTLRGGHGWRYELKNVWKHASCHNYNASNTIIINDEKEKVITCSANSIHFAASFTAAINKTSTDYMRRLNTYLSTLVTSWKSGLVADNDVRKWIATHPF